jgi:LuxR family maltose regulon positive regulatory protein
MIRSSPFTVIEAPSGYGKTTAVRDFLKSSLPKSASVFWFTAEEETPAAGFSHFCCEIEKIDAAAGRRLMRVELPNAATVGEACRALRELECNSDTYLVIDDFHHLHSAFSKSLFTALTEHGGKGLHIVIITQMLSRDLISIAISRGVMHINTSDLRLDAEDIHRYFALSDSDISAADADRIAGFTEGWVIAVYLQLCAYRETGALSAASGIYVLMERLVWDALDHEQQTFLLRLSPLKTFTLRQAFAILGCDKLPEYAHGALKSPFIHYSAGVNRYEVHSILSEILVRKRKERGSDFDRECLLRAGDLFKDEGIPDKAFDFYVQSGDYDRMLSLDLSGLILEEIGGRPFHEIALTIAKNCPVNIKSRRLLSMLVIAWALLNAGKTGEFDDLMEELRVKLDVCDYEDAGLLRGEWLLLSCWRRLPYLDEMTELVRQAAPFFQGSCSRVILPTIPWCFGDYSQCAVFHIKAGEADREADALEEFISIYSKLTGGHGSGADVLFRAELAHFRGNLDEAEILAYKASFLAESSRQSIIRLGTALKLAEIAVEKSDTEGWQRAIASMEQAASYPGQNSYVLRSAVEMLRSLLFNQLVHEERVDEWLKKGETEGRILPAMRINALFIRLSYLMHRCEFSRLAGMAGAAVKTLKPENVLADTILSQLAAIGYLSLGDTECAEELAAHSAQLAMSDGFCYLPAVYSTLLRNLPDQWIKGHRPEHYSRFAEIKERFITGFTILRQGVIAEELPGDLTPREREVALLAASGLRNSEIAEKLTISESTVRAHMRTIFQKLDIDRRARLAEKLK